MTRKEILAKLAEKLKKIRQTHKFDTNTMAAKLRIDKSTYNRNERGLSLPEAITLYSLGESLNISLDWFIREKGPMYYTEEKPVKIVEKIIEKKEEKKEPPKPYTLPPVLQNLEDDLKELIESMEKSPQLRYEMLAHFLKLKKEQEKENVLS